MNDWPIAFAIACVVLMVPLSIWATSCGEAERQRVREACVYMTGNPECEQPKSKPSQP